VIGATWKKATQKVTKETLRNTLLHNPELIKDLLNQYRKKPAQAYDFDKDPDALVLWYELARQLVAEEPLGLITTGPMTADRLVEIVTTICDRFRQLVEKNRYSRMLYNDNRKPRPEKIAQLAFFGLADAYCEANELDISPESDGGAGPVDFKISASYDFRATVEVKLSSNSKLVPGFETQLPAYNAAEKAVHSVYLVIQNGPHDKKIRNLQKIRQDAIKKGQRVPALVVVDGRLQPSASKLGRVGSSMRRRTR